MGYTRKLLVAVSTATILAAGCVACGGNSAPTALQQLESYVNDLTDTTASLSDDSAATTLAQEVCGAYPADADQLTYTQDQTKLATDLRLSADEARQVFKLAVAVGCPDRTDQVNTQAAQNRSNISKANG